MQTRDPLISRKGGSSSMFYGFHEVSLDRLQPVETIWRSTALRIFNETLTSWLLSFVSTAPSGQMKSTICSLQSRTPVWKHFQSRSIFLVLQQSDLHLKSIKSWNEYIIRFIAQCNTCLMIILVVYNLSWRCLILKNMFDSSLTFNRVLSKFIISQIFFILLSSLYLFTWFISQLKMIWL